MLKDAKTWNFNLQSDPIHTWLRRERKKVNHLFRVKDAFLHSTSIFGTSVPSTLQNTAGPNQSPPTTSTFTAESLKIGKWSKACAVPNKETKKLEPNS